VSDTVSGSEEKPVGFSEWIEQGVKLGFCTPIYCQTHDGFHASDMGVVGSMPDNDFCWFVVRLKENN